MQVTLKFPSGHTKPLLTDVHSEQVMGTVPLDVLIERLNTWGVWYGGHKHRAVSARFVTNNESVNFEITMEVTT